MSGREPGRLKQRMIMNERNNMSDRFDDYQTFADYLLASGWVPQEHISSVTSALAAFENEQRRRGSEAARIAMDKAARKAW